VSYPKRIRAPPSKRRSHLRSHLRSWTLIGNATRSRRPAMPCRPLLREPDSARAAKPSASRASALPIYVMIPAKNQRGQPEENSRPSLDNGFGVQRLAAISASADASAVIPARTATVMTDVSGGTGRVSTVRIAATSMDNITVSEREGQAERAPSRPIVMRALLVVGACGEWGADGTFCNASARQCSPKLSGGRGSCCSARSSDPSGQRSVMRDVSALFDGTNWAVNGVARLECPRY
jgi:hypothetical protein